MGSRTFKPCGVATPLDLLNNLEPLNAPARGFDAAEFQARLDRVQAQMSVVGIDVLMLNTEPEVRYFTGFLTQFWQSPTRPWFLLVPQTGKPVAVIPSIGIDCMARTWIEDIRTWSSPHPDDDGVSLLSSVIEELCGRAPVIGMTQGRESNLRMPLNDFYQLQTLHSGARWQDATPVITPLRQIKSESEIDKIRFAANVASRSFDQVPSAITSGMTEIEAFRRFKQLCLQLGADDVAYLVGAAGSAGYEDIISPPTDRALRAGDILIMDTGCVWDGYYCDFDRNFAIKSADQKTQDAYRITWDATEAGLSAVRPGATCADLFTAMNAVMAPHATAGGGEVGRLGHGLGMQLTESPSHTSFDQTTLKPGMVLTLEPGYSYAPGKMMVHEENLVVRDSGFELLSHRADATLPIIG